MLDGVCQLFHSYVYGIVGCCDEVRIASLSYGDVCARLYKDRGEKLSLTYITIVCWCNSMPLKCFIDTIFCCSHITAHITRNDILFPKHIHNHTWSVCNNSIHE